MQNSCKVITFYINCKIILQSKPQNRQQHRIWITLWEDNFAFKKNIPYKNSLIGKLKILNCMKKSTSVEVLI